LQKASNIDISAVTALNLAVSYPVNNGARAIFYMTGEFVRNVISLIKVNVFCLEARQWRCTAAVCM